jgi:beta-carotene 3-hydroxylase
MTGPFLLVASFVVMEGVSYAAHRWVMHGFGMGWHRSHHVPSTSRYERNDLFPATFSIVGFALFLVASLGLAWWLWWVAAGITAYGACYLFVHEVYIHRRVDAPLPRARYFEWLREAHADHHRRSGEPYGMLLPLRRDGEGRSTAMPPALDRSAARRSTRAARARL